jgi:hypothetical protein
MGVTETTVLEITCDHEGCTHDPVADHNLDPAQRTGWLFVTHEVYGQPTETHVYCCSMCLGDAAHAAGEEPMP